MIDFAGRYCTYVSENLGEKRPTLLTRLFGVYRIGFKNATTGRQHKQDILIMEHLFYDRSISRVFDLKVTKYL